MEKNPPSWTQGGAHPAENDRLLLKSLLDSIGGVGPNHGVVGDLDLRVIAVGSSMAVSVFGGGAFIQASEPGALGSYHVYNDGTKNVVIPAADPTNPRIDLIVARVRDAQYSGAVNSWAIEVVQGIAAGSPVQPAAPDNSLTLARVAVGANVTSISSSNITDLRVFMGGFTAYTPTWTSSGTQPLIGNGSLVGRYRRSGKLFFVYGRLLFGTTTGAGTGAWTFGMPFSFRQGLDQWGDAIGLQPAVGYVVGKTQAVGGTNGIQVLLQDSSPAIIALQYASSIIPGNWVAGDSLQWWGSFEMA